MFDKFIKWVNKWILMKGDNVRLEGIITRFIWDANGNLLSKQVWHNVITNASLAVITGLVGNVDTQVAFTKLALGTGNTAAVATQTALVAEITDTGLARASATVSRQTTTQTNDTLRLYKQWTASGAKTIAEVGIFNDPTTGTMLGRQVIGPDTTENGTLYAIQYDIKFSNV